MIEYFRITTKFLSQRNDLDSILFLTSTEISVDL